MKISSDLSTQNLHINILELKAVVLALKAFNPKDSQVLLYTDNETTRCAITKKMSKSASILREITQLIDLTLTRKIILTATRIPSQLNVVADALSRQETLPTEWSLKKTVFQVLVKWHGLPQVDLMATPLNRQVKLLCVPSHTQQQHQWMC